MLMEWYRKVLWKIQNAFYAASVLTVVHKVLSGILSGIGAECRVVFVSGHVANADIF